MKALDLMLEWLFPRKCVLCRRVLSRDETDLCHSCRIEAPVFEKRPGKIPYVSRVTAVWYYEDTVRRSLIRFKFYNVRSYARVYGQMLAMKVLEEFDQVPEIVTWVPVSARRKRSRGYDQVELIGRAMCRELGVPLVSTLHKRIHTKPNSSLSVPEARRANVSGVYAARPEISLEGKRVLLLDDIVTTGATASECARVLRTAGAKEVFVAAAAAVRKTDK